MQDFLERAPVARIERNADRRPDGQFMPLAGNRPAKLLDNLARKLKRRQLVHGDMRLGEDGELVATDARNAAVTLGHGIQPFGNHPQDGIADKMSERVVDGLEAVEVDQHQGELRIRMIRTALELFHEVAAVSKPGERITLGQAPLVLLLRPAPVRLAPRRHEVCQRTDDIVQVGILFPRARRSRHEQHADGFIADIDGVSPEPRGTELPCALPAEDLVLVHSLAHQRMHLVDILDLGLGHRQRLFICDVAARMAQHQPPRMPLPVAPELDHQRRLRPHDQVQLGQQGRQHAIERTLQQELRAHRLDDAFQTLLALDRLLGLLALRDVMGNRRIALDPAALAHKRRDAGVHPVQGTFAVAVAEFAPPDAFVRDRTPHLGVEARAMLTRVKDAMRLPDDFLTRVFRRLEKQLVDLDDLPHRIGHGKDRVLVNGALVALKIGVRALDFAKRLAQPRQLRARQPKDRLQQRHGHEEAQHGRDDISHFGAAKLLALALVGCHGLDQAVRLHPVFVYHILQLDGRGDEHLGT